MIATIKDVAKEAGVSIATVSRVINGKPNVKSVSRDAVLKAIEVLGYQPNSNAQAMKKKTFCTIGVIISDFSVPFFEKIIKKLEREFRGNGNLILFVNTYDDPDVERKGIQFMVEKQADVLIISSTGENEDYLRRLQEQRLSIIFLDRRARSGVFPSLYVDKRKGMYAVMEYLDSLNHNRIALISGPRELTTNYDRYEGASRFYYEREKEIVRFKCFFGSFTEQYGYEIMAQLQRLGQLPSAVVVGSAAIATGVISYCKEFNIRIPQDVSLISFGDLNLGKLIEPRLTYVDDCTEEIGNRLVKMVRTALVGKLEKKEIVLDPVLVCNDSVCESDEGFEQVCSEYGAHV